MSGTRTLNLHSRAVEAAPTSQKPRQAPQDTQSEPGSERATSPASVAILRRSYSDVLASRPPSREAERFGMETQSSPVRGNEPGPRLVSAPGISVENVNKNVLRELKPARDELSQPASSRDDGNDENENPWTEVKRRQSSRRVHGLRFARGRPRREASSEHRATFQAAEKSLTPEERARIERRSYSISQVSPERRSVSSRGEGPSQPKEKGIDPREWGNVNWSEGELDMEVQKTLLKQGRERKQKAEKRAKKLRLTNEATAKERAASILSSRRDRSAGATSAQYRSESRELGMKPANLMLVLESPVS